MVVCFRSVSGVRIVKLVHVDHWVVAVLRTGVRVEEEVRVVGELGLVGVRCLMVSVIYLKR